MNIVERYGIKEVADVTIYELDEYDEIKNPVLFLDTLRVCELEFSKEEIKHYGGKGNTLIVNWDYVNEINIKLEDALFSMKSLAVLLGGEVAEDNRKIIKTEIFEATGTTLPQEDEENFRWNSISGWNNKFTTFNNKEINKLFPKFYDLSGEQVNNFVIGEKYYCTYYLDGYSYSVNLTNSSSKNYCIIGETFIRSEITNKDKLFYFIIPKAKLKSNLTLTFSNEEVSILNFEFVALKHKNLNLIELMQFELIENIDTDNIAILGKAVLDKLILGDGR